MLELRALFSPCLSLTLSHRHTHTHTHMHTVLFTNRFSRRISLQKPAICIEILPVSGGHVAGYWISLAFCAIVIVCHFCLRPRLCVLQIKPMETWKVEHCPHFHQEIAYQASPWLPRACVTFFIKVALVSPMLCPIWALDSSVKSSSQANSSPFPNLAAVSPLFIFSPSFWGLPWCPLMPLTVRARCHGEFKSCYRTFAIVFNRVFWPPRVLVRMLSLQAEWMPRSQLVLMVHTAETPYPRQEPQPNFDRQFKTSGELGHRGVGEEMMAS